MLLTVRYKAKYFKWSGITHVCVLVHQWCIAVPVDVNLHVTWWSFSGKAKPSFWLAEWYMIICILWLAGKYLLTWSPLKLNKRKVCFTSQHQEHGKCVMSVIIIVITLSNQQYQVLHLDLHKALSLNGFGFTYLSIWLIVQNTTWS